LSWLRADDLHAQAGAGGGAGQIAQVLIGFLLRQQLLPIGVLPRRLLLHLFRQAGQRGELELLLGRRAAGQQPGPCMAASWGGLPICPTVM